MQVYSAIMPSTAVTVAKDLLRVSAPATASMVVLRAWLSQQGSETSDQLSAVIRRATDDGTGTANTPLALHPQAPAFPGLPGSSAHDLTVDAVAGDKLHEEGFNLLNGFLWVPTPEERIIVPPSGRIVLRLHVAPAASTNIVAGLYVGIVG